MKTPEWYGKVSLRFGVVAVVLFLLWIVEFIFSPLGVLETLIESDPTWWLASPIIVGIPGLIALLVGEGALISAHLRSEAPPAAASRGAKFGWLSLIAFLLLLLLHFFAGAGSIS